MNIKDLDKEKKRISLGYKKAEDNPWTIFQNNYNVDDVVKAKVVSEFLIGKNRLLVCVLFCAFLP